MADTKNPADEQRYPPGCPDPDWCRGNGCYWRCKDEPGDDLELSCCDQQRMKTEG